ncbi:MAG: hypothetical protein MJ072_03900, partial [Clostridia bacterium]|nr:hypothetical protein [Clostridia bacterium]
NNYSPARRNATGGGIKEGKNINCKCELKLKQKLFAVANDITFSQRLKIPLNYGGFFADCRRLRMTKRASTQNDKKVV